MRYVYRCPACNETIEVQHRMDERPAMSCSCRTDMVRVIQPAPFIPCAGMYAADNRR
jgi:putative FmdB family regulatory protein